MSAGIRHKVALERKKIEHAIPFARIAAEKCKKYHFQGANQREQTMPAAKAIDAGVAEQRTVLVVEDVAAVRLLMADIVRSLGYSVLEASNGEEAIHVIERSAVHVVLSDVYMPNAPIDGLQLAHWIHDQRPGIKVILTSGVVSAVDPAYADFHEGPLLQKPVRPQELERRLRSAFGDRAECR